MTKTAKTVRVLQAVSAIAGVALLLWTLGLPSFNAAQAANLTDVSDTLSDSNPGSNSDHTISFTIPTGSTGVQSGETIVITFETGFDLGSITDGDGDIDFSINGGGDETLVAAAPTAAQWSAVVSGQTLTLTSGGASATAAADDVLSIEIGDNATGGASNNQIVNPNASSSYLISISSGSGTDTGETRVAIIENVNVSASVDTLFTFAIAGVGGSQTVNGVTTTGTTSAVAIPFGTLTAGNATRTAQDLTVTTNATQGYSVTVVADQDLLSSTGADIDGFVEGSYTTTPTSWSAPTGSIGSENTYGHWGLTSDDATTTRAAEFGSDEWVAASTTPVVVMGHTGPADGTTAGVGTARVGYQIEITSLQEAGDDYQTTLTYIATPTF